MCGIVGYVGGREAADILIQGLSRLEYRGYDSAGVAIQNGRGIVTRKVVGRVAGLETLVQEQPVHGASGIGHTRWATHGVPNQTNAHPHTDCTGTIALVHNGIIENYAVLRKKLEALGHTFRTDTDTESVAHLIEEAFEGNLEEAVRAALRQVELAGLGAGAHLELVGLPLPHLGANVAGRVLRHRVHGRPSAPAAVALRRSIEPQGRLFRHVAVAGAESRADACALIDRQRKSVPAARRASRGGGSARGCPRPSRHRSCPHLRQPDPRIEHPNDVILRVTRAAICGSDLHLYRGLVPDTRVGHTFGHEFTGVVEEVGPEVRTVSVGDRLAVPFNISCGTCFYCERDLFGMCENTNANSEIASGVFGYSHSTGGYDGGQAEYVRVPYADVGPVRITMGSPMSRSCSSATSSRPAGRRPSTAKSRRGTPSPSGVPGRSASSACAAPCCSGPGRW